MTLNFRYNHQLVSFETPIVMGILNATPDSFYSLSRKQAVDEAVQLAAQMLKEGATILDIGGQSTRPGAERIGADEESDRVIPVIQALVNEFPDAIISIDTFYGKVARESVAAGAGMINDVSAWQLDPEMLPAIAELNVPYILMHMQGNPQTMQDSPDYSDVVNDVIKMLSERLYTLRSMGVSDIFVDPGFGFGKTLEQNYEMLRRLREFSMLDCPILAGVSRKGMIYKALGIKPEDALNGTTAAHMIALMNGASILRVHDVHAAMEAIKIANIAAAQP